MPRRRYRRRSSTSGAAIVGDVVAAAGRAPWWAALMLGIVPWVIFAFAMPAWIEHQQSALHDNMFREMVAQMFDRRVHWLKWIGNACLIAGLFFAVRKYFCQQPPLSRNERGLVAFLSRILGRGMD